MADKIVSYKNSIISASLIDDFYNRLNQMRLLDGVDLLEYTSPLDKNITPSDIAAVYSAILSTKNAVSFLQNENLKVNFNNLENEEIIKAFNSASILEYNIGQLENACVTFFSSNRVGFETEDHCTADNTPDYISNIVEYECASNNVSNLVNNSAYMAPNNNGFRTGNLPFMSSNNAPFCLKFNSKFTGSNISYWAPNFSSGQTRTFTGVKGVFWACATGTIQGCQRGGRSAHNLPFFSGNFGVNFSGFFSANFSGFFSPNFSGFNCPTFWSGNNATFCSLDNSSVEITVNSVDNSAVCATNNLTNYISVEPTCSTVWGSYSVEGIVNL